MDPEAGKRAAGAAAVEYVRDGMTIGLGTGSTARWFIEGVGARVRDGLSLRGVPTSDQSATLAIERGIPLVDLDGAGIDIAVDGADAVDHDLRLIKGRGGAMVREKIVAAAARQFIVVVDTSKRVTSLNGLVPVEMIPFGHAQTLALLENEGAPFALRRDANGVPLRSDNGNLIADGGFKTIDDPEGLAERLDAIPGVVGHGLFLGMADTVLVGDADGSVATLIPTR